MEGFEIGKKKAGDWSIKVKSKTGVKKKPDGVKTKKKWW